MALEMLNKKKQLLVLINGPPESGNTTYVAHTITNECINVGWTHSFSLQLTWLLPKEKATPYIIHRTSYYEYKLARTTKTQINTDCYKLWRCKSIDDRRGQHAHTLNSHINRRLAPTSLQHIQTVCQHSCSPHRRHVLTFPSKGYFALRRSCQLGT